MPFKPVDYDPFGDEPTFQLPESRFQPVDYDPFSDDYGAEPPRPKGEFTPEPEPAITPEQKYIEQPRWKQAIGALPPGPGTALQFITGAEPMPVMRQAAADVGLEREAVPEPTKAVIEGYKGVVRAPLQFGQAVLDQFTDMEGLRRVSKMPGLAPDIDYETRKQEKGAFIKYLEDVAGMGPQMATQWAAHYVGGKALNMAWMGVQIAGPYYEELRRDGVPPGRAFIAALANAAVQAPMEAMQTGFMFRKLGKKGLAAIARRMAEGGTTEFLTEWAQKYPEWFATLWAKKEKPTWESAWEKTLEGMYEGLVALPWGALGGGGRATATSTDLITGKSEDVAPENVTKAEDAQALLNRMQADIAVRPPEIPMLEPGAVEEMPPVPGEPTAEDLGAEERFVRETQEAQALEQRIPLLPPESVMEVPETRGAMPTPALRERPVAELPSKERELEEEPARGIYGPAAIPAKKEPTTAPRGVPKAIVTPGKVELVEPQEIPSRGRKYGPAAGPAPGEAKRAKMLYQKELKQAEKETEIPTKAQIESGKYKKGRINAYGFEGVIETPKGVERLPGRKVKHPVGYFRGVKGADGDQVDAIFGPEGREGNVFVIDQTNRRGAFDEHKVMVGFKNRASAKMAHKTTYGDVYKVSRIVEMTPAQFKRWMREGDKKRPASETPPITEEQWKNEPKLRPEGYLPKTFLKGAEGSHAQATNRAIIAEYRQWLKNMGYTKPTQKTQKDERAVEAKRRDTRSAPIRFFEKELMSEVPGSVGFGDVREVTKLNKEQKLAKRFAKLLGVDLAFFDMDFEYGASGVFIPGPNTIVIRANSPKPAIFILTHEVMHDIEIEDPALYKKMRRFFWDRIIPEEYQVFADALNDKRVADGQMPLPMNPWTIENKGKHTVFDEYMPEFAAHQIFKKEFWNSLQKKAPHNFGKFVNAITKMLGKIRSKISHTKTELLNYFYDYENELTDVIADAFIAFSKRSIRAGQMRKQEKIASAAIMYDGKVYLGVTHFEAYQAAEKAVGKPINILDPKFVGDGFVTSEGRYVDRDEAMSIAKAFNQIKESAKDYDWLASEDLKFQKEVKALPAISEDLRKQMDIDLDEAMINKNQRVWYRGSAKGDLRRLPNRGAFYFTTSKEYAEEYGPVVKAYRLSLKKTWDYRKPETLDDEIKREMLKHPEFPSDESAAKNWPDSVYADWDVLEDAKIRKLLKAKGYDSYRTSEFAPSIAVFDEKNIKEAEAESLKFQIDFVETIPAQAKITKAKKVRDNGQIGSPLGNKLAWMLPEMIEDAVRDKPITESWVKSKFEDINPFEDEGIYKDDIIEMYIVGSEAKGTATKESDLDIAIVIPKVEGKTALKVSEEFHQAYGRDLPLWNDRDVDFQFFYEGDPELKGYDKILIKKSVSTKAPHLQVRDFFAVRKEWRGFGITPHVAKTFSTQVKNYLSGGKVLKFKNKNEYNEVKKFREGIASGEIEYDSNEYNRMVKKYSDKLQLHTVKHRERFQFSSTKTYGPADEVDVKVETEKEHPIRGKFTTTVITDPQTGNIVVDGPIFSQDRPTRIREIIDIVNKNKETWGWYEEWNAFMNKWADKVGPEEIVKYIKIQAVLSAQKGPQGNQLLFAKVINTLESGETIIPGPESEGGSGIEKNDIFKILRIWNGLDTETTLKDFIDGYGKKVGPYMFVGLHPMQREVVVIDRHMAKPWGYNIMWSPKGWEVNRMTVAPEVAAEVAGDIMEAAEEVGIPYGAAQAALWFEIRELDVEAATYGEAVQIQPDEYLPGVMYAHTVPEEMGEGIHYKRTLMEPGDFIYGATADGTIKYNDYSRGDIQSRIDASTTENPYTQLVYAYEAKPGMKPEYYIKQGREAHIIDFTTSRIYDGINDILGYMKSARARIANDKAVPPGLQQAAHVNAMANLIQKGKYDGFVYQQKDKRVIAMFEKAAIKQGPENLTLALSDVIEDQEKLPQTIKGLEKILPDRAMRTLRGLKSMADKYTGMTLDRLDSTIARFGDATSGAMEIGGMVRVRGPANIAKAFGAEWGVAKKQNYVYLMRKPAPGEAPNGVVWSIPVGKEYDMPADLEPKIEEHGLTDFNIGIKHASGRLFIEQFFLNEGDYAPTEQDLKRFKAFVDDVGVGIAPEMTDVVSDMLDKDSYKKAITDHYGEKEGNKIYEEALKKGEEYFQSIKEQSFGENVREGRKEAIEKRDEPGDGSVDDSALRTQKDLEVTVKPPYYSELKNYVMSNKFQAGRPKKVKAFLEQQMNSKAHPFKKEEWDWSNVSGWLDLQPDDKVIKAEDISEFMDNNVIRFKEVYRGGKEIGDGDLVEYIRGHYYEMYYDSQIQWVSPKSISERFPIEAMNAWPQWTKDLFDYAAEKEGFDLDDVDEFSEMADWWEGAYYPDPNDGDDSYYLNGKIEDLTYEELQSESGVEDTISKRIEQDWDLADDDYLLDLYGDYARDDMVDFGASDEDEDIVEEVEITGEAKWGESGYNIPGGKSYREVQVIIESVETPADIMENARHELANFDFRFGYPNTDNKIPIVSNNIETHEGSKIIEDRIYRIKNMTEAFIDGKIDFEKFEDGLKKHVLFIRENMDKVGSEGYEYTRRRVDHLKTVAFNFEQKRKAASKAMLPRGKKFGFEVPAHWEELDVLYHVRFDTRYGPNKEKVLFIQEMQSDWHQQGASGGYRGISKYKIRRVGKVKEFTQEEFKKRFPDWPLEKMIEQAPHIRIEELPADIPQKDADRLMSAALDKKFSEDNPVWVVLDEGGYPRHANMVSPHLSYQVERKWEAVDPDGELLKDSRGNSIAMRSRQGIENYIKDIQKDLVPDAPFKTNWYMQAFKRMVRYAAAGDYDYIAMTTGEQQVQRWNQLLKRIDRIEYEPNKKLLLGYDYDGTLIIEKEGVEAHELDDYMGKSAAEQLLKSEINDAGFHSTEDIRIGGRFLRNLYNKKIPRDVNKMFNKEKWGKAKMTYGGHVISRDGSLYNSKEDAFKAGNSIVENIISMPVTDKMKQKAAHDGLPLYNKDLEVTIDPGAKEIIDKKIAPKRGKTLRAKLDNSMASMRDNWRTRMFDRLHPIKKWLGEGKAYMLARGIPGVQSTFNTFLTHGKLEFDESGALTTNEVKKGFLRWYDGLGKDGEKFFYWLVAKRAESLKKQDREFLFNDSDIKKILNWVGEKPTDSAYDNWFQINKEFKEFNNNILKLAQQSGLISKDFAKYMMDTGFYVPFYRIMEDEDERINFLTNKMNPKQINANIKKLTGSDKPIGDPVENTFRNWGHLLSESVHNVARRSAYNHAVNNQIVVGQDEDGNDIPLVEKVSWADTVIFKKVGKEKGAPTFVHTKTGEPILQFKRGGENVYFRVNDPEFFNALGQMNPQLFDQIWMRPFTAGKRWLTFGATFGMAFRVKNFLRDTMHTAQISEGFYPLLSSLKGIWKIMRNNDDWIKFQASGMAFSGSHLRESDPASYKKFVNDVVKKEGNWVKRYIIDSPVKALNLWNAIGEAFENAARVELYSIKRKRGGTHLEAGFAARDLMDFNMSGNAIPVRAIISTVPFTNARMQGLYKMGRAAREHPLSFFGKSAFLMMASFALWWKNKDDERYQRLEDWEKFAFYHVFIGDRHLRIPKPFETGVLFSTSIEMASDVISGNEELSHVFDYIAHAFNETLAFNPTPQVVKPVVEQIVGKSFFTGRPIESLAKQRLSPGQRFDPWDSEFLRLLGDKLNISPKRAQALIRGYLSVFGMFLLSGADAVTRAAIDFPERPTKRIDDYPLIGSFLRETKAPRYTKFQSEFYDALKKINQIHSDVRNYEKTGKLDKARKLTDKYIDELAIRPMLNRKYKRLSDISTQIKAIWNDMDMEGDKKKAEINKLLIERNDLVKEVYEEYLKEI